MSTPRVIALIRARESGWLSTAGRLAPANAMAPTARAAARLSMLTSSNPRTAGPPWTTAGRRIAWTAARIGSSWDVVQTMYPSTAASVIRWTSSAAPVIGRTVMPYPRSAQTSAIPARKDTAPGSSNA